MTVAHSQPVISHANQDGSVRVSTVVKTAPISTISITGLRHMSRGSSLRSASGRELANCRGSSSPEATLTVGALIG